MWNALTPSGTRNDFKIFNFKKREQGPKARKACKQVRDQQIVWKQVEDTAQGLLQNRNKF